MSNGYNHTSDCYRTINGERYVGWAICPTQELIAAYRAAGAKVRRFADEAYVREGDIPIAASVDASQTTPAASSSARSVS